MRTLRGWTLLAVVATATGAARAEVRLEPGGLRGAWGVSVQPTPAGPWTPAGPVDARTLNPDGDRLGDSFPAHASEGAEVVAAWTSPASGGLAVAGAVSGRWLPTVAIPAGTVVGLPSVERLPSAWVLAWEEQEPAGSPVVALRIVATDESSRLDPRGTAREPGLRMVGTAVVGETLHLLAVDPVTGDLWDVLWIVPDPPISPIPVARVFLGTAPDAAVALAVPRPWSEAPGRPGHALAGGGLPSTGRGAAGGHAAWLRDERAATLHDVSVRGERVVAATWWTGDRTLSFVELGEHGPLLPVETLEAVAGVRHPQGLVQQALREIAGRH